MQARTSLPHAVQVGAGRRLSVWYGLIIIILSLFLVRLFYLQVMRHEHYKQAALSGQLKEYSIRAERGIIQAHDGDQTVPLVLNQTFYTLFADPTYIKDPKATAGKLSAVVGGDANDYEKKMISPDTRYVILAKKLDRGKKEAVMKLELKGIGTREETYRTYAQGNLAAQLLGFVDTDGNGKYGVEEALDKQLRGKDGLLKAITDASGVPLAASRENLQKDPVKGQTLTLAIDITMQRQVEDLLKQGLDKAKSQSGSAVVIDPNSGAVKAVANYPTFNPAEYYKETNAASFSNPAFSAPLEPGSVMKPLTAAAALEQGVISPNTTYYDPGQYRIDGATIRNIEEDGGGGTRSITDILQLSLNTGATWMLSQMGGGDINRKARTTWYDYMTNHYRFGRLTNIEGYEVPGIVPDPIKGDGLNIQYANTSFGQGITVTPLQLAAAISSIVNGGVYYQPYLVESTTDNDTIRQPKVLNPHVVSPTVSQDIRNMMQYTVIKNIPSATRPGYAVGGKTGTAQIAKPGGGYYEDRFNGTYVGYVGGDRPQYVIVIRVNEPKIGGYAGSKAAAPIFSAITNMLIDNFNITPQTQP